MAVKIKKGDHVVVLTGKDKGKHGEVLKVMPDENRAIVKGVAKLTGFGATLGTANTTSSCTKHGTKAAAQNARNVRRRHHDDERFRIRGRHAVLDTCIRIEKTAVLPALVDARFSGIRVVVLGELND